MLIELYTFSASVLGVMQGAYFVPAERAPGWLGKSGRGN